MAQPKLSIVIGSNNARTNIVECLTALDQQQPSQTVEIIVVDNSMDGTAEMVSTQFPDVQLVRGSATALIPELWEIGIQQSTGDIVALMTAHCVPGKAWIEGVIKSHDATSCPGIGGAIELHHAAGLIDWAIYFCRYSLYMLPFSKGVVREIAGDNASYKRWALDRCAHVRHHGFWEVEIHAVLRQAGYHLCLDPSIVIYHKKSFGFFGFIRQRFWHGRQFGGNRAVHMSGLRRTVYSILSPLIPLVFLTRIARQVLAKRRYIWEFLFASPILLVFLLSWSTGELMGYLRGPRT